MPAGPAPTGANAPGGCLGPARGAVAAHSAALAEDPTASGVASLASLVLPANKARTSGRRGRKGHDRAAHARKLLSFIIGKGPAEGIRCGCERSPHGPRRHGNASAGAPAAGTSKWKQRLDAETEANRMRDSSNLRQRRMHACAREPRIFGHGLVLE